MLAIDFGTTNTCAAVVPAHGRVGQDPTPQFVVEPSTDQWLEPTCIFLTDKEMITGARAKAQSQSDPSCFQENIKRSIRLNQPIEIGGKRLTPIEAIASVLRYVLKLARNQFDDESVRSVVLTVPSTYTNREKEIMSAAAALAGISGAAFVEEPYAAAVYHEATGHITMAPNEQFLVYDFGGGTFDVTLIEGRAGRQSARWVDSDGERTCGGADIDEELFDLVCRNEPAEVVEKLADVSNNAGRRMRLELLERCRIDLKHVFSNKENLRGESSLPYGFDQDSFSIGRDDFLQLIQTHVAKTVECCRRLLNRAKTAKENLKGVILVGGSSSLPGIAESVRRTIREATGRDISVVRSSQPQGAVVLGAAYWGYQLQAPDVWPRWRSRTVQSTSQSMTILELGWPRAEQVRGHWIDEKRRTAYLATKRQWIEIDLWSNRAVRQFDLPPITQITFDAKSGWAVLLSNGRVFSLNTFQSQHAAEITGFDGPATSVGLDMASGRLLIDTDAGAAYFCEPPSTVAVLVASGHGQRTLGTVSASEAGIISVNTSIEVVRPHPTADGFQSDSTNDKPRCRRDSQLRRDLIGLNDDDVLEDTVAAQDLYDRIPWSKPAIQSAEIEPITGDIAVLSRSMNQSFLCCVKLGAGGVLRMHDVPANTTAICFSCDSEHVMCGGSGLEFISASSGFRSQSVYDSQTHQKEPLPLHTREFPFVGKDARRLLACPLGAFIASAGPSGVKCWDNFPIGGYGYLRPDMRAASTLEYCTDTNQLLIAEANRLYIWSMALKRRLAVELAHQRPIRGVSVSRSGAVAASCDGCAVYIWDLQNVRKRAELPLEGASAVFVDDSSSRIIAAVRRTILVLDATTMSVEHSFDTGHVSNIRALKFDAPRNRLVTISTDGAMRISKGISADALFLRIGATGCPLWTQEIEAELNSGAVKRPKVIRFGGGPELIDEIMTFMPRSLDESELLSFYDPNIVSRI